MKIALIVTLLINVFLIYRCYKLALQNSKMASVILSTQIKDLGQDEMIKESFLKFISDSRDWAFEYIEEVQVGLEKFINIVEPHIKYYDEYGIVIEGIVSTHDKALQEISKEFKELKKLLPSNKEII